MMETSLRGSPTFDMTRINQDFLNMFLVTKSRYSPVTGSHWVPLDATLQLQWEQPFPDRKSQVSAAQVSHLSPITLGLQIHCPFVLLHESVPTSSQSHSTAISTWKWPTADIVCNLSSPVDRNHPVCWFRNFVCKGSHVIFWTLTLDGIYFTLAVFGIDGISPVKVFAFFTAVALCIVETDQTSTTRGVATSRIRRVDVAITITRLT